MQKCLYTTLALAPSLCPTLSLSLSLAHACNLIALLVVFPFLSVYLFLCFSLLSNLIQNSYTQYTNTIYTYVYHIYFYGISPILGYPTPTAAGCGETLKLQPLEPFDLHFLFIVIDILAVVFFSICCCFYGLWSYCCCCCCNLALSILLASNIKTNALAGLIGFPIWLKRGAWRAGARASLANVISIRKGNSLRSNPSCGHIHYI